jgi:hypothetical protein
MFRIDAIKFRCSFLSITSLNCATISQSNALPRYSKYIFGNNQAPSAKNGSKQDSERIYACIRAPKNSIADALRHACPSASVTQASACGSTGLANRPYLSAGMCAKLNYGESHTFDTGSSASKRNILAVSHVRSKTRRRLRNNLRRFFRRSPRPTESSRARHQEK